MKRNDTPNPALPVDLAAITCAEAYRVVSANSSRPALAANARSVRGLDQRDHAAADAGRDGDSLLGAIPEPLSATLRRSRPPTNTKCSSCGRGWAIIAVRGSFIAAAAQIMAEHCGVFPTTYAEVRSLPGIGRYTAGAILSIGLDQRLPILEANTVRVLSRLTGYRDEVTSTAGQRHLWSVAESILPRQKLRRVQSGAHGAGQ